MYTVQKVYLIHDYLYASLDLIPSRSLDGKDTPSEHYIIVSEPITELPACIIMYPSQDEAREALAEWAEDWEDQQ